MIGTSWTVENECHDIVEESASSETKETANRVRASGVGTLTAQGSSAHTNWRKMVKNLDQLAPYEGTSGDEWP
jgi:hypothetical protein